MKERIEVMFTAEEITKRLEEIAQEVYEEFGDEQVEMVCVLKGGVVTLVELAKKMKMPVTMNFMDVSSYGDGTESSGHIKILRDLDEDITGKNVLLVEDIIDSGRTLSIFYHQYIMTPDLLEDGNKAELIKYLLSADSNVQLVGK